MIYQLNIEKFKKNHPESKLSVLPDTFLIKDGDYQRRFDVIESSIDPKILKPLKKYLIKRQKSSATYMIGIDDLPVGSILTVIESRLVINPKKNNTVFK